MPGEGLVCWFLGCGLDRCLQLIQPKLTNNPQNAPSTTSHACAPPSGGGPIAGVAGAGPVASDFGVCFSGSFPYTLASGVVLSDF